MTPSQIELVQNSFNLIRPNLESVAMTFYERVFELHPALRHMFHGPREDQARKVAHVLTVVVNGLSRPQQILGAVEELGRRHLIYGARPEHYADFGAALLWTLQTGLGDVFTPEVREAWTCAYLFLSSTMQQAAANAETVPVDWVPVMRPS
jgi:hemoglobin-like flavoprotein